jgi:lipid A 4'-phosphatase
MRPILYVCLATLLASALFLLWPGLDLRVASLFYRGHGEFALNGNRVAAAIHEGVPAMMQLAGAAIVLLLAYDLHRRQPAADAVRQAVFLVACFIIGPGLVANTLLKDNWGRPRPLQIVAFGGPDRFAPPLVIGDQCPNNCSFVAGDAAAIFTFLAFALLLPAGWPRRTGVIVVAVLGVVMGIIRMGQGEHFLSDVIFAGLFMALVVLLLRRLLPAAQKNSPNLSIRQAQPRP